MDIRKLFLQNNEEYAPAVMWFTAGNINKKEMTYQLEGFKKQGINDFFIHPVLGTVGDYLGPYFFRMVKHARDEAKRLGMRYWMYDEYNWSSGVAAGQVLRDAPWAHGSCLLCIEKTVEGGESVRIEMPKKERFHTELLLAAENGVAFSPTVEGDAVLYENKTDSPVLVELFVSKWDLGKIAALQNSEVVEKDEEGYLDTLDPEAVDAFISSTHEKYKAEIGEDFGGAVKGMFCDEVITYFDFRDAETENAKTLPWSRRFAERFEKRCGYDIIPHLHTLMKGEDKRLLIDYWESVAAFMMEGFAGRTNDWCEKNGLIATGHIDGEESIISQVYRSGDNYEFYKRFGMPGVDTILTYFRLGDYTFATTPKIASSAAHFLHKERILSETFTISGWEIKLADKKRAINKLAFLGINFIQYMGARYDFVLAGNSMAMTNNFQNPLFRHYGTLSKYTEALQAFVSKTEYDAHTLLFYPMTTARALISHRTFVGEWDHPINMTISGVINSLLSLQHSFEVGFEQVIDGAEVSGGRLMIDGRYYDTVILPETEYLKPETFAKLSDFAAGGGKLISVNGQPLKIIDADGVKPAPAIPTMIAYTCRDYEFFGENHPCWPNGQPFDGYQCAPMGVFTEMLSDALGKTEGYPLSIAPKDGILSAFRKDADGYYALVANDTETETEVVGELKVADAALFDTESGEERYLMRDGASFRFILAPFESAILSVGTAASISAPIPATESEIRLSPVRFSIEKDNFAHPAMHHVRGSLAERIIAAHRAANPARVCNLAAEANGENSVLCRGENISYIPEKGKRDFFGYKPIDKKSPRPGETVVCVYDFEISAPLKSLSIVCDPEWRTTYYLNDERLCQTAAERIWHYANPVYDISDIAEVGKNRLVAVCELPTYQRVFPLPAPVLKGDFRLFSDFVLTAREGEDGFGYWNDKGYACYGGDGLYETSFAYGGEGRLLLSLDTKDTVEVLVNGTRAALKFSAPYEVDITEYAKKGENSLALRVTSTLSNFIYKSSPSGLRSAKLILQK